MLKALNLNNSTNLSSTRIRDRLTIRYQAEHGFTNLLNKYPKRTYRYRNADATIFITHYSGGANGNKIIQILFLFTKWLRILKKTFFSK